MHRLRLADRKEDEASDIHRQNVQRARAVARMEIFDRLSDRARQFFSENGGLGFGEPDEDQICEAVGELGAYFDDEGRLRIPGRE